MMPHQVVHHALCHPFGLEISGVQLLITVLDPAGRRGHHVDQAHRFDLRTWTTDIHNSCAGIDKTRKREKSSSPGVLGAYVPLTVVCRRTATICSHRRPLRGRPPTPNWNISTRGPTDSTIRPCWGKRNWKPNKGARLFRRFVNT